MLSTYQTKNMLRKLQQAVQDGFVLKQNKTRTFPKLWWLFLRKTENQRNKNEKVTKFANTLLHFSSFY